MLQRLRKATEENERGFTLIELLVVIIIIGILAAIAIPVFLNQRRKGYDAAAKSDIRNAATALEAYLTDYSAYNTFAAINTAGTDNKVSASKGVTVEGLFTTQVGYCLWAKHTSSNATWYFDSQYGGLQPKGQTCTVTYATSLGSITTP